MEVGGAVNGIPPGDLVLDARIGPAGARPCGPGPPRQVLLTGATGFLGGYLLARLLATAGTTVHCLVRGRTPERAAEALDGRLRAHGIDPAAVRGRVVAVSGTLSKPLLGWSADAFAAAAERIDTVYHCAASVNLLASYEQLRTATVLGTAEVLRFAATHRVKPVHYISTLGVLAHALAAGGGRRLAEDDPLPPPAGPGYCRAKWVAELLVRTAAARGLPVRIHRPGAILGDDSGAAVATTDWLMRLTAASVRVGAVPRHEAVLPLATAGHIADAVVALSLQAPPADGPVYHTVQPQHLSFADYFALVRTLGHELAEEPYDVWLDRLAAAESDSDTGEVRLAQAVEQCFPARQHGAAARIGSDAFQREVGRLGLPPAPAIDAELIRGQLDRLLR
ncbi:thioester reductase domain-containing protein [Kitasatospora sp. NPDC088134]|uniref:thioester reductase domain-containing protein n=1 Tax=Kitasatospora sp. NPDC088134 TaxID=3364071 RepID=UPI003803D5B6